MSLLLAAGVLTVTWCLLLVWVGRIAASRGRSMLLWAVLAGGAGILGNITGFMLAGQLFDSADVNTTLPTVVAMFTPLIALVIPMVAVGMILQREPIHVARRGTWQVAILGKGEARIDLSGDAIRIELEGSTLTASEISKVEADGECVRIMLADQELVAMPMGKPATPAGRRHQSLMLAKQLRQAKSLH